MKKGCRDFIAYIILSIVISEIRVNQSAYDEVITPLT